MKSKGAWVVLGLVGVLAVAGLWAAGTYNRLVGLNEGANAAWAQVENVLQRRFDLIPNLVNTVKGYAKHEAAVLEEVTRLRSQWGEAKTPGDKIAAAQGLEGALSRLMVVIEKYPDLKANENFLKLQDELAGTENRIAVERMRFNEAAKVYNVALRVFPGNLVARWAAFAPRAYFEAAPAARTAPVVQF
ncbi:MAG TPA: LemA family protein [Elusimicrobiota bacterium]|nr:LemA family protein [Elusimicrobiota bacterium]